MTTQATITISTSERAEVDPDVYGHFLESAFFGNIEGGVFDEGSPLSVTGQGALDGCRLDVIEACRELGLPVVRWPGGNFTSAYWWRDGVGPRDERPRRLELAWRSEESNRFGTPEFLAWVEAVTTDATPTAAYLHHGARSVDDAVRWVEYTNYAGRTEMTALRAADGHPDPYDVLWWGVGNEIYGPWQMGHRSVEQYVQDAREHTRFMRQVDSRLKFIACGWEREEYTEKLISGLGDQVDAVSLHLYGLDHHLTDPTEAEFDDILAQPVHFEQEIAAYADEIAFVADRAHLDRAPTIVMDEWNNRHMESAELSEPVPAAQGGFEPHGTGRIEDRKRVNRHSSRTLADALMYSGVFHAIHRAAAHEVPVTMANAVNLINANGILQVRPEGVIRTPLFHIWRLYQNLFQPFAVRADVTAPAAWRRLRRGSARQDEHGYPRRTQPAAISLLDVSASTSQDGRTLTIAAINRSATDPLTARLARGHGELPDVATCHDLGAEEMDLFQVNTLSDPEACSLRDRGDVTLHDGTYTFPAHSVTLLTFAI
ncbi:alpha-N-arabinofuranosidase [Brachybacterium alimentarium]|uniref:non-reducing end alpha-L-arabinofuranosidase n=1 Tax=Brachybacterium alimentarium TaxID=47845 RepID=A0A2A3YEZ8_9MICO|nr:alpha-L-arabinofuranosidase C-terminal domain-containing protein [Brachybacterium alimentarium]PCC37900.1 alpha-N-arabinofuranosidase [Brachybacterium alimentarium]